MTTTAKLFVTDYASYNDGKQFEHGHWVDLTDFDDADGFNEYLKEHFEKAGINDPEPMFTDFEGFPSSYYSESMSQSELEKLFKYIELDYENKSDDEKIGLWNEYCAEQNNGDDIYAFDEDFFNTFFNGKPMECARAAAFGNVNWSHEYIRFNGYGNLESFDNPVDTIDEDALIDYLIEQL